MPLDPILIGLACLALGFIGGLLVPSRGYRPGSVVPHTAESIGDGIGLSADTVRRWRARGAL